MKQYEKKSWTEKECDLLKSYYKNLSMSVLLEILPGRTETSIRKQIAYMKKKGFKF